MNTDKEKFFHSERILKEDKPDGTTLTTCLLETYIKGHNCEVRLEFENGRLKHTNYTLPANDIGVEANWRLMGEIANKIEDIAFKLKIDEEEKLIPKKWEELFPYIVLLREVVEENASFFEVEGQVFSNPQLVEFAVARLQNEVDSHTILVSHHKAIQEFLSSLRQKAGMLFVDFAEQPVSVSYFNTPTMLHGAKSAIAIWYERIRPALLDLLEMARGGLFPTYAYVENKKRNVDDLANALDSAVSFLKGIAPILKRIDFLVENCPQYFGEANTTEKRLTLAWEKLQVLADMAADVEKNGRQFQFIDSSDASASKSYLLPILQQKVEGEWVSFYRGEDGYLVAEGKGVVSQGKTFEGVRTNIREAIQLRRSQEEQDKQATNG